MSGTREENLKMAEFADASARYDDMVTYMGRVVHMTKSGSGMSPDERDSLIVAFKNSVSTRRKAIAVIDKMTEALPPELLPEIKAYRAKIVGELNQICEEIVSLLEGYLLPIATGEEEKVIYLKTQGDFYRYMAPYAAPGGRGPNEAAQAYDQAMTLAQVSLPADNANRLGAALNQSVCLHEVLGDTKQAIAIARSLLNSLETASFASEESRQNAEQFKLLVQDNLNLWVKPGAMDDTTIEDIVEPPCAFPRTEAILQPIRVNRTCA
eukprot:CAMPEP_0170243376 /NCGR_PEP_ID=MMETSP0116_2-20130129/21463_1 /TAXON_ID=400756 /ORGANISM="Durinskia baltica, Strain CSIRO CS-38" /LENGTH=266 /DNA_ID=CAMNT_0010494229 /DNA_START=88 /DNA_END=886 /DNA_ORIENTATION=-